MTVWSSDESLKSVGSLPPNTTRQPNFIRLMFLCFYCSLSKSSNIIFSDFTECQWKIGLQQLFLYSVFSNVLWTLMKEALIMSAKLTVNTRTKKAINIFNHDDNAVIFTITTVICQWALMLPTHQGSIFGHKQGPNIQYSTILSQTASVRIYQSTSIYNCQYFSTSTS